MDNLHQVWKDSWDRAEREARRSSALTFGFSSLAVALIMGVFGLAIGKYQLPSVFCLLVAAAAMAFALHFLWEYLRNRESRNN